MLKHMAGGINMSPGVPRQLHHRAVVPRAVLHGHRQPEELPEPILHRLTVGHVLSVEVSYVDDPSAAVLFSPHRPQIVGDIA